MLMWQLIYIFSHSFPYHKVVALMGMDKGTILVMGPQEQVIDIIDFVDLHSSSVILFMLKKSIEFTRFVRPLRYSRM